MYKTTLFGKTREFSELTKLIAYAQGVRDSSNLSTKELLFEFRVYQWHTR
jgi:hypothetical protein